MTTTTFVRRSLLAASVTAALSAGTAFATNGMAAHGYGTVQKAMGGAAVAGSDNAMNMATNPASLSNAGNNWTAGLELFKPERSSVNRGASVTFDGNGDDIFPVPEFAYQRSINNRDTFGVAVYGNGGMNTSYDRPIYSFTNNTGLDLAQLLISPSWSRKLSENNSIGVSLNLAYQRFKATGIDNFAVITPSGTANNLSDQGYDSSTGAGVTLGWQGKLDDKVTAGIAYRSRTYMSKFGKYKELFAEQGDLDIPAKLSIGVSMQASPKTTIAMDFDRIFYGDVKSMANKNNSATGGQLGNDNGPGFGWDDQTVVKLGIRHQVNPKLALMAGYNHADSPVSPSETAFNVLASATVEDHITLGADWQLSKASNLTVQYMHALENEVKGDGTPGSLMNGMDPTSIADVKMDQNAIGVAYTREF